MSEKDDGDLTIRTVKEMLRVAARQPRDVRQKFGCTSCDYIHPTDSMEWAQFVWNDKYTGMCYNCVAKYRSSKSVKGRPRKNN